MNVTPDGSEVWVGSSTFFTGKVTVLDPRSGAVPTVLEMFGWPYRIHFTADTRTVLVHVIDRASRRDVGPVEFEGGEPGGLAITPDGRYAFQTMMDQSRIAVVDVRQRRVVGNLHVGDSPDGVAYTPRVRGVSSRDALRTGSPPPQRGYGTPSTSAAT